MADVDRPIRKRRIPKACVSCRRCKVKCDGKRPCTRCSTTRNECVYFAAVKDPTVLRLEELEYNIQSLSQSLNDLQQHSHPRDRFQGDQNGAQNAPTQTDLHTRLGSSGESPSDLYHSPRSQPDMNIVKLPSRSLIEDRQMSNISSERGSAIFRIRNEHVADIVSRNLVTLDEAHAYFHGFFMGCDRFVPVFDPEIDTFESVRSRSGILFDVICTFGSRMANDPQIHTYQLLNKELKSRISEIVISPAEATLESVQALLVVACYSEKGWLLTSIATRMALLLDLPRAYDEAVRAAANQGLSNCTLRADGPYNSDVETSRLRLRRARTWLGLVVLEHIFSLDSGKIPGIEIHESIRRCRLLVAHPSRTILDLRLLSQVELNSIRAKAFQKVSMSDSLGDAELIGFIQDIKIDLDMWLEDWLQMILRHAVHSEEREVLNVNLQVQRDWAEIMMCCKALQSSGIENIAVMSPEQQQIIHMAKESSHRHLEKLLASPKHYLATFRYTMDFVWAKCAFSVLLLLKLAILLPLGSDLPKLLGDAKRLLEELSSIDSPRNIYFQILSLSVQKAEKALRAYMSQGDGTVDGGNQLQVGLNSTYTGPPDAEFDFQTYVPKEFVFEWDFPSLTLCFVPTDLQDLFSEFLNM